MHEPSDAYQEQKALEAQEAIDKLVGEGKLVIVGFDKRGSPVYVAATPRPTKPVRN